MVACWLVCSAAIPTHGADHWTFGSLTESLGHTNRIGGQDRTAPAIGRDGSVYLFGDDYRLRAITPGLTNGVFKWRSDTTNSTVSLGAEGSPSVASDGTIWMVSRPDSGTTIYALNPTDGTRKGSYVVGEDQTTIGALAIDINDWSFTSFHGRVVALGANTNGTGYELKWDHVVFNNNHSKIVTMPAISTHTVESSGGSTWTNQLIYWAEQARVDLTYSNRVFAMRQKQYTDGTWSTNQAWVWDFPGGKHELPVGHLALKSDNTIYVLAENTTASPNTRRIYALSGNSGAQLWYTNLGFSPKSAPVLDQDGKIYIGGEDGLYRVDPGSYETTKLLGTVAPIANAPLIGVDGGVYCLYNTNSTAYVTYTNTLGTNSWTLSFTNYSTMRGSPVMDRKGRVYAILSHVSDTSKGQLLAVQGVGRPAFSDWPMWGRGYSRNNRAGKTWRAINLGSIGGPNSSATAIAGNGIVAGFAKTSGGVSKAVLTSGGSWYQLNGLTNASGAYGINDEEYVVGYNSVGSPWKGFRWKTNASLLTLNNLSGGSYGVAVAINNNRRIVGYGDNSSGYQRGVFWDTDSSTENDILTLAGGSDVYSSAANAVSASGRITGWSDDGLGNTRAFLTGDNGIIAGLSQDLGTLGGYHSYGFGINDAEAVVGMAQISNGVTYHAFYKPLGQSMQDVGLLSGALLGRANDINNNNLIVGTSLFTGSVYRAAVAVGGMFGMVNLNDVTEKNPSSLLATGIAVNDADVIVGQIQDQGYYYGVLLRPNE